MFKTKNDMPEATRAKVVELLNARLADCIDLQTQTKQAHWNVKGPDFIALHELFDKVNEAVEYPVKATDGRSHLEALSSALAAFGAAARNGINQADDLGDQDTADIFTEVSRGIDKWLWFVEAHLQAER